VDIRHLDTRDQVRVSLDTSDKRKAIARYPQKLPEIQAGFDALRVTSRPISTLIV
jgi:hypothetical protein